MGKIKFNIECEMSKEWAEVFCSMLKKIEKNGNIGHSELVAIFADGDGDFHPTFKISEHFKEVKTTKISKDWLDKYGIESFYDRG